MLFTSLCLSLCSYCLLFLDLRSQSFCLLCVDASAALVGMVDCCRSSLIVFGGIFVACGDWLVVAGMEAHRTDVMRRDLVIFVVEINGFCKKVEYA